MEEGTFPWVITMGDVMDSTICILIKGRHLISMREIQGKSKIRLSFKIVDYLGCSNILKSSVGIFTVIIS